MAGKEPYGKGKGKNGAKVGKPGDWICPACGDLVYASRDSCRKCGPSGGAAAGGKGWDAWAGAPADVYGPPPGALPKGAKPGDWICPACGDLVYGSRDSCRKCGPLEVAQPPAHHPPPSMPKGAKPGDWICPQCGNLVYGSREFCRICGPPPAAGHVEPEKVGKKEGDWICPQCGDLVYASRDACRNCGPAPKPIPQMRGSAAADPPMRGSLAKAAAADHGKTAKTDEDITSRYLLNDLPDHITDADLTDYFSAFGDIEDVTLRTVSSGAVMGSVKFFNPTYELRRLMLEEQHEVAGSAVKITTYKKNKQAKSGHGEAHAAHASQQIQDWTGAPPPKGAKPGDWICPACGDLVYGSRDHCRKCGPAPPVAAAAPAHAAPPKGMKPGDWICPACGDVVFGSRDSCRKCGPVPAPVAEPSMRGSVGGGPPMRGSAGASHHDAYGPPAGAAAKGAKPGDWICPDCGDLVYGSRDSCRKCGPGGSAASKGKGYGKASKHEAYVPGGSPYGSAKGHGKEDAGWVFVAGPQPKPGDWLCEVCGELVFASKGSCRKCDAAKQTTASKLKPAKPSTPAPVSKKSKASAPEGEVPARYVLNDLTASVDQNDLLDYFGQFGEVEEVTLRVVGVKTISSVKFLEPTAELMEAMLEHEHEIKDATITASAPGLKAAKPAEPAAAAAPAAKGKGRGKPGDWTCPACGDLVFASRDACRCGQPKPLRAM